jgi:hypothetical protein
MTQHPELSWRNRLIAVAVGVGSMEHAVGLVGLLFGWQMYANYPLWRHAAFASVDASIAWLAVRQPRRLFLPLLALLAEQIATNGTEAWQSWHSSHRVEWMIVLTLPLIACAVVATYPGYRTRLVRALPSDR